MISFRIQARDALRGRQRPFENLVSRDRGLGLLLGVAACLALIGCACPSGEGGHITIRSQTVLALNTPTIIGGSLVVEPAATLRLNAPVNDGVFRKPITNEGSLEFAGGRQVLLAELRGGGALKILAPADVTLAAANSFYGPISIGSGATLRVTGSLACGNFGSPIHNDGRLVLSGRRQVMGGVMSGGGELQLEGGELVLGMTAAERASMVADRRVRCADPPAKTRYGEDPSYPPL